MSRLKLSNVGRVPVRVECAGSNILSHVVVIVMRHRARLRWSQWWIMDVAQPGRIEGRCRVSSVVTSVEHDEAVLTIAKTLVA